MDMQNWRDERSAAGDAAEALREALADLGVPERDCRSISPVVTGAGTPYVHLGMLRPDAVEQIAEALRRAT
ncbi:hypothetical protein [Streptomyces sp. CAU 1734]|uniref:hypothetical protein n=1 Tax=Streptomyces sp. CAU 1734 TaxID=3140360 RepID=UPI0032617D3B